MIKKIKTAFIYLLALIILASGLILLFDTIINPYFWLIVGSVASIRYLEKTKLTKKSF